MLQVDGTVRDRVGGAYPALRISKASSGRIPKTEAYNALWGRKGDCRLHRRGGEGIRGGGRTAGNDTAKASLAILWPEVAGK
jgi:hypothetical protein